MSGLDPVLVRGLSAIEPYLGDVVLAGGWVPHVYELLYDATRTGRSPRTRDIDLAVPRSVPVRDRSIDELLLSADFECEFISLGTPPATRYVAIDDGAVEIEFITDAPGSAESVVAVQPDLTAQELHYVGLLLQNPWTIDLGSLTDCRAPYSLRVPNPGVFVFHKALVSKDRRDRLKAEKDLYCVFFVLDHFPGWEDAIKTELARLAESNSAWFTKCLRRLGMIFGSVDSVGVDALLNQRPQMAYPGMTDDQFRQLAFTTMSRLIAMMEAAL